MAIAASDDHDFETVEHVKASLCIFPVLLVSADHLVQRDQNLFFHFLPPQQILAQALKYRL